MKQTKHTQDDVKEPWYDMDQLLDVGEIACVYAYLVLGVLQQEQAACKKTGRRPSRIAVRFARRLTAWFAPKLSAREAIKEAIVVARRAIREAENLSFPDLLDSDKEHYC